MSRDWTKEELDAVSKANKARGLPTYEEFCKMLDEQTKEQQGIELPQKKEEQKDDD